MPELTVIEGGVTNSRPTPESRNRHGVDTVRYRYRSDAAAYAKFAHAGASSEGPRGELHRQADGVRIGAHRDGMLYAEGRLAAILNGADDHSLVPMASLEHGAGTAAQRFGFDVDPTDARLGRLDIAAELTFDDGSTHASSSSAANSIRSSTSPPRPSATLGAPSTGLRNSSTRAESRLAGRTSLQGF